VSFVPEAQLGESPLWPAAAIVAAALLYVTLPGRFIVGPSGGVFGDLRWIVAGLTLLLLAALLLTPPQRLMAATLGLHVQRLRLGRRVLALTMIAVLTAANSASIYLLVHVLVNGGRVVAAPLLRAAVHDHDEPIVLGGDYCHRPVRVSRSAGRERRAARRAALAAILWTPNGG